MDTLTGTILKGKQIVVRESFQRKKSDSEYYDRRRYE